MPTPWAAKGMVMRTVVEAAGDRDTSIRPTGSGDRSGPRLDPVLPDPSQAVTHLWAEGADADSAQGLLDEWAAVVERAGR